MVGNGQVTHLEDYHNLLNNIAPEGPYSPLVQTTIDAIRNNPQFSITEQDLPSPIQQQTQGAVVSQQLPPPRPAVFHYHRPGMVMPHVVEFTPDYAAIDGQELAHDELQLMLQNARNGLATITWKGSASGGEIKPEVNPGTQPDSADITLIKAEGDLASAMAAVRAAIKAGHIAPEHGQVLTDTLYTDPMLPGVGNKYAANEFLAKQKPGVYGSIDLNEFRNINNKFGHPMGDEAIKAAGHGLREAANKAGKVRLFRNGGDEFILHAPIPQDAHTFLRYARSNFDNIPPIQGVHKLSFSAGLGTDYNTADKALYHAKANKLDPTTGMQRYLPHNVPHLAHSLIPGQEGPINLHQPEELAPPKAS
jgi:GGDEF domain-containing protein